MVAALMSLNALAIDIMLPALSDISEHYTALTRDNDQQLVIFAYIAGFGAPQLVFGPDFRSVRPKSDLLEHLPSWLTRSRALACIMTNLFRDACSSMRFVQGMFASGVRVIAVSIVRDLCWLAGPWRESCRW